MTARWLTFALRMLEAHSSEVRLQNPGVVEVPQEASSMGYKRGLITSSERFGNAADHSCILGKGGDGVRLGGSRLS